MCLLLVLVLVLVLLLAVLSFATEEAPSSLFLERPMAEAAAEGWIEGTRLGRDKEA